MLQIIKHLRNQKGISQRYLGTIAGVSQQAINSYENSDTQPDFRVLISIADYFQVSVDYLLGHKVSDEVQSEISRYSFDEESMAFLKKYLNLTPEKKKALDSVIDMMSNEK